MTEPLEDDLAKALQLRDSGRPQHERGGNMKSRLEKRDRRRRAAIVGGVVVLVLGGVGVGSAHMLREREGANTVIAEPSPSHTAMQFELPSDRFAASPEDIASFEYAQQLVMRDCMRQQGFPMAPVMKPPVRHFDEHLAPYFRGNISPGTVEKARHDVLTKRKTVSTYPEYDVLNSDRKAQWSIAYAGYPQLDEQESGDASSLVKPLEETCRYKAINALYSSPQQRTDFENLYQQVSVALRAAHPGNQTAQGPVADVFRSLDEKMANCLGSDAGPSDQESVEYAVLFEQCALSVGVYEKVYPVIAEAERVALQPIGSRVDEYTAQVEEHRRKAASIIADLEGKQPDGEKWADKFQDQNNSV